MSDNILNIWSKRSKNKLPFILTGQLELTQMLEPRFGCADVKSNRPSVHRTCRHAVRRWIFFFFFIVIDDGAEEKLDAFVIRMAGRGR